MINCGLLECLFFKGHELMPSCYDVIVSNVAMKHKVKNEILCEFQENLLKNC